MKAGVSMASCRTGYGIRVANTTTSAKYARPARISGVAHLRSTEPRRNRNPQQAPKRNSGNRTSGLNFSTFSQFRLDELSSTRAIPSGFSHTYRSVMVRLAAQQSAASRDHVLLSFFANQISSAGNNK